MALELDGIVKRFSSNLYGLYHAAHESLLELQMQPPCWIKSYLIFSLEKCRSHLALGLKAPSPYCRFSLGSAKTSSTSN